MNKLFYIKRIDNYSYCDDYAMVVCAENERDALETYPDEDGHYNQDLQQFIGHFNEKEWETLPDDVKEGMFKQSSWVNKTSDLECTYLGIADEDTEIGPILVANMGS